MSRVFPSPVLSGTLFLLWLLLSQSVSAGTVLLGVVLATVLPILTAGLRPARVRVHKPRVILRLTYDVVLDMLRSNVAVVQAILTKRSDALSSAFVRVPLDVRDPNALAVLAMIVCFTPGTSWAELAFDRSALLLHVLDVDDEAALVAAIKRRYERPLMEIFE